MSADRKEQEPAGGASKAFHAFARGRVQGVGFRQFVWTRARALGLSGYVRNGADGRSVEVAAEGDAKALDRLLEHLHGGPFMSRVDEVEVEWRQGSGSSRSFEVRY